MSSKMWTRLDQVVSRFDVGAAAKASYQDFAFIAHSCSSRRRAPSVT